MQQDVRGSALYQSAEELYRAIRQPGAAQLSDAQEIHAASDGRRAVFTGLFAESIEEAPFSRICQVDLSTAEVRVLTFGRGSDRLPKYSPDSRHVAFLSDREEPGTFQLYLLTLETGALRAAPIVDGFVESLQWSHDGTRILIGAADHGADVAGAQGAVTSKKAAHSLPAWAPRVEAGLGSEGRRRAWVYDMALHSVQCISPPDLNIWECMWCGNTAIAAVASAGPTEGDWYDADLEVIELSSGRRQVVLRPAYQIGWPAVSRSGRWLAIVEATCSDRLMVAGELRLIDRRSDESRIIDTHGVDVTSLEWCSEHELLIAGHRGFETVIGCYDLQADRFTPSWTSAEASGAGRYISVSGTEQGSDCVFIAESFTRSPEIAHVQNGRYRTVRSLDLGYQRYAEAIASVEQIEWRSRDGLRIQGWLLRPAREGPYPLVMEVHGGPVWHWKHRWLGRSSLHTLLLLREGYAVFLPNPRGSDGRGQAFVREVLGDLGGLDATDLLTGLDHLVESGIADPARLGVTGVSYGGYMTAWLVTQDSRFAAAVSVAPITNYVTSHLISNIPHFVRQFLGDTLANAEGKYFSRSPVMFAHQVSTPMMSISGDLDRCTPPQEAMQFHRAIAEKGVDCVWVSYPREGHGIRNAPALLDYSARLVGWFQRYMSASA